MLKFELESRRILHSVDEGLWHKHIVNRNMV
jgi:hypothetical protein